MTRVRRLLGPSGEILLKARPSHNVADSVSPTSFPVLLEAEAAVGGLAVNAVIDKWEDGKKDTADKQEKWDDKFDRGAESDGGKSQRSQRSRRDRTSRGDSRYVDGYSSDEEKRF